MPSRRKRFTIEYKTKIVLYYRSIQHRENVSEKSINHICRLTGIDHRTLGAWIKNGDSILQSARKRRAHNIVDRSKFKCICQTMELELKDWILKQRAEGKCVSGDVIQKEAVKLYNQIHGVVPRCPDTITNFNGSRGWFRNFCKRRGFVLRRVSSTGRELPGNVHEIIHKFFQDVSMPSISHFQLNNLF